ncbi:hypothetical protein [Streptomyces sp. CB01881]|uniref:hypothetical protein n=1 Tax=Streptomyces sp. CB01881 TaxID=2078691 RepID=UPI001F11D412|nr:hypothetical protein [Streptomyces sp. CB01881]
MPAHPSGDYAITALYSVPDDAWYLELDLVREQRAVVTAVVPDEDPAREPTVCFDPRGRHLDIPYAVMRWFMDQVEEEIRMSRAWMQLRPSSWRSYTGCGRSTSVSFTTPAFPMSSRRRAPLSPRRTCLSFLRPPSGGVLMAQS